MKLDWDIIKGILILFTFAGILVTIFFIVDDSGPNKAKCIADALKSKVPVANIDKICRLTETRPGRLEFNTKKPLLLVRAPGRDQAKAAILLNCRVPD